MNDGDMWMTDEALAEYYELRAEADEFHQKTKGEKAVLESLLEAQEQATEHTS